MKSLASLNSLSWLCAGDFNEITEAQEKWGGKERSTSQIQAFRMAIEEVGLCNLGYTGATYTWLRGTNPKTRIIERLDRALADAQWNIKFPMAKVSHLATLYSDHLPLKIRTHDGRCTFDRRRRPKKSYKFEEMWVGEDEYQEIIQRFWVTDNTEPVNNVALRGHHILRELTKWGKRKFENIKMRIEKEKNKLNTVQCNPKASVKEEIKIRCEIERLLALEERFWRQRSRQNWLKNGDRIQNFFIRKQIKGEEGISLIDSKMKMDCELKRLYHWKNKLSLFSKQLHQTNGVMGDWDEELSSKRISEEMNE